MKTDQGNPQLIRLEVETEEGERLDRYLARHLSLSRTRIAALILDGRIRVDGRAAKKSETVETGALVEVEVPPPEPLEAAPEEIPLEIAYEDEHLLVVNKPAGMVVHPAPGHPSGTLVNALLHHIKDLSGIGGRLRPGIVHRLDRDTSGLLVVAKGDDAHQALSNALRKREVRRIYLALAWGTLPETPMTVDQPLGRDPRDRKRMAVVEGGRRAVTRFRVRETWQAAQLLDVSLETGRTHQIRVHLAHMGHPVVGDDVYGRGWWRGMSGPARPWAKELERKIERQFLHASDLVFHHPVYGKELKFHAPPPDDLKAVLNWGRRPSDGMEHHIPTGSRMT